MDRDVTRGMSRRSSRRTALPCLLFSVTLLVSCVGGPSGVGSRSTDILDRLHAIQGLTVVEEQATGTPDTRFFVLDFEQPVDHQRPEGHRFRQRVTLLHRSGSAPMVFSSTGYAIWSEPSEEEPTALLRANQLQVEHRFFGTSTPEPATFEHLALTQVAADHHRLIEAFKPLYPGRWVSTGVSKGGMTTLVHRFLYPRDVDASVAYVAASIHGPSDARFAVALDRLGDATCRERLRQFQRTVLSRREELAPGVAALAAKAGATFEHLGQDQALEFAVLDMPFFFWSSGDASRCPSIPSPEAPASELLGFLDGITHLAYSYGDEALAGSQGLYYQSATELGWPLVPEDHLKDLLRYPNRNTPLTTLRVPVEPRHDSSFLLQVEQWSRTRAERLLLVYGENDPWTPGGFSAHEPNDSFRFTVPGGNHTAQLRQLPEPERTRALERLSAWTGVAATP
jgi:hypothetical protein